MTDRLQPETVVDGRYRVERRLGSGGMADVYCATDLQLGRRVALKLLYHRYAEDSEFVERFRREASAAAGLQHRHVVSVYDRGEWDGTYYIAMEYLEGRSLKALIRQEAPLDPDRAVDLTIQILTAARFAHQRGIIHRDLKPQNVIVDADGQATVTDFGIARSGASDMTETGSIMGTAQYLSPEQAQGHTVSAQSDLYSIGIILYEMLTGRVPFDGDSAVAIALKQVSEPPVPPSAINPAVTPPLEQAVMRALGKEPSSRYADADAFIAALEGARAGLMPDPGPPTSATMIGVPAVQPLDPAPPRYSPPPEDEDGPSRRWWIFALVALLVVGALIAGLLLLKKDQVTVPAVVGSDVAAARAALLHDGFAVDTVDSVATQKSGTVIGQNPEGGSQADEGATVVLTVSSGPGQAQVPSVDGLSESAARRRLQDAGFKVKVREKASDDIAKGDAIDTEPPAGTPVDRGGSVTLIVSSGKQEVAVPNVVGAKSDAAQRTLEDAGFSVDVREQEDDSAPEDSVLSQDPAAGEKLPKGSRVSIVVATKPAKVDVPNTVGDDENGAIEELSGAGFKVKRTVVEVTSEDDDGIVQTQDPSGGGKAERGTTVTIGVGSFTPPSEPNPAPGAGGTAPGTAQ